MTHRSILIAVTVLLGFTKFANGQESKLQIRAVLHDPAKPDAKFFVGKPGETLSLLKLSDEGLTDPQLVTAVNGRFNVFKSATVDPANAQASLAASVAVPPGAGRLIVIILPSPQGGASPYGMVALDDSPQSFPWGESKAVNLTPAEFAVEAGEHKVLVPSGKISAVQKVTKLNEFNRAQTNFYYKQADQWVVAAERQMQYMNTIRRVFLIYKAPAALGPDVRTIIDYLPPPVEKNP